MGFFRAKDLHVLGQMFGKVAHDFSADYCVPFLQAVWVGHSVWQLLC